MQSPMPYILFSKWLLTYFRYFSAQFQLELLTCVGVYLLFLYFLFDFPCQRMLIVCGERCASQTGMKTISMRSFIELYNMRRLSPILLQNTLFKLQTITKAYDI